MTATLDLSTFTTDQQPSGAWVSALLYALARDEVAGRRPKRLTEPNLGTWNRFRGRLSGKDLISLLFEDAAVIHKVPFDASVMGGPLAVDRLPASAAQGWLEALPSLVLDGPSAQYISEHAKLLGLLTRLARSDLYVVKPHQKVLLV